MLRPAALVVILAASALVAAESPLMIDYPADGSVFPPDFAPPTFVWRDAAPNSLIWRIEITFESGAPPLQRTVPGSPLAIGEIDYRAVASTNELPKLTAEQQAARTWKPDRTLWETIKKHSVDAPAVITILGLTSPDRPPVSGGRVRIRTAREPVAAPIFFRDVPLMPSEVEKGVIKPLPKSALPLIAWRLRYVDEDFSRLLVTNLPTCANCHSFSSDGKTLGMDLDGPANDKGLYVLAPIRPIVTIRNQDVIAWSSFRGKLGGKLRVGFMSQVSPDGQYVVTMVNPYDLGLQTSSSDEAVGGLPKSVRTNFYVANFKDYRFLQVFYPTRGVLAWYSRATGRLQPLPGADDPRYVHTNAVWSPDGKYLVFARAEAREPYPEGARLAEYANDPNETQIRYDLYRIPFNGGRGGKPEPILGASGNGMSNSFPKISPDGRWIVFVQARNGLLMRPDSQLYIIPAQGGAPRRMRCNTERMNSWHSFAPNGRWMVFSSKSRSPYTQMYLTYLDENGNDSPPVLVENATAANRAVNLPEFVNLAKDAWLKIEAPATEFYRISDTALELLQAGRYEESIAEWKRALAMEPSDAQALSNLGAAYSALGRLEEALEQFRKALHADPDNYKAHANVGVALARMGRFEQAVAPLRKALELSPEEASTLSALGGVLAQTGQTVEAAALLEKALERNPDDTDARNNLGSLLARQGRFREAAAHFRKALDAEPNSPILHFNFGRALAASGDTRAGIRHVEEAVRLSGGGHLAMLDTLSALYAGAGRFDEAAAAARRALALALEQQDTQAAENLRARLVDYQSRIHGAETVR
jgi:tetratricopeptide (TPR) repeat protein